LLGDGGLNEKELNEKIGKIQSKLEKMEKMSNETGNNTQE